MQQLSDVGGHWFFRLPISSINFIPWHYFRGLNKPTSPSVVNVHDSCVQSNKWFTSHDSVVLSEYRELQYMWQWVHWKNAYFETTLELLPCWLADLNPVSRVPQQNIEHSHYNFRVFACWVSKFWIAFINNYSMWLVIWWVWSRIMIISACLHYS